MVVLIVSLCGQLLAISCLGFVACLPMDSGLVKLVAYVGDSYSIPCHQMTTHFVEADWVRVSSGSATQNELCLNGVCVNGYFRRFSVRKDDEFRLTISNITLDDSGKYTCIAMDGYKEHRFDTELTIIERPPDYSVDDTTKVYSDSVAPYYNSTVPTQQPGFLWLIILPCAVLAGVVIIIVVCRKSCRNSCRKSCRKSQQENKTEDLEMSRQNEIMPLSHPSKHPAEKTFDSNYESLIVKDGDICILTDIFLKIFQKLYDTSCMSDSATKSFQLLASSSSLWFYKLRETATKQRIRRRLCFFCSKYAANPSCSGPLHCGKSIAMGVACLKSDIYTISRGSSTINHGADGTKGIVVGGMEDPVDIIACTTGQCLYIADKQQRCVWRVLLNGGTIKWKQLHELEPRKLSVRSGSLLITTDSRKLLKCSSSDEESEIRLTKIMRPLHAVETSNKTFIVCGECAKGGFAVTEVVDRKELRRFLGQRESQMLRYPTYLEIDRNGYILVADNDGKKIVLLDRKLTQCFIILDNKRDGITAPRRLSLDEDTGKLLVVSKDPGSISVYVVKPPGIKSPSDVTSHL